MKPVYFTKKIQLTDDTGRLAQQVIHCWLIGLRESNPAILDMFWERDQKPYRDMLPWSGEFAGKYLVSAYYLYRITLDRELLSYMRGFLSELLSCIDESGYIGCFQKQCRLTGAYSQTPEIRGSTWDAWSHYYIMYGLYLWSFLLEEEMLLSAAEHIASCFLHTFYQPSIRVLDMGSPEMNLAPLHIFVLLYQRTGKREYLNFAENMLRDVMTPEGGNYIRHAADGLEYYQFSNSRWEALPVIRGIYALHSCTGEAIYKKTAEHIFYSIQKTDIHNTGGFSTNEQAIGTPYLNGVIELCSVIAYHAFACDVLAETGDEKILDMLECSYYNAVLGSFSPSGRWSTYDTPMEGVKVSSCQSLVFQSRPGSPELNSCSVNAPQGIGMLSEWMAARQDDVFYLNYYGNFEAEAQDGLRVIVEGDYLVSGEVSVRIWSNTVKRAAFRIPAWADGVIVRYRGREQSAAAGEAVLLDGPWQGEPVRLSFAHTVRMVKGGGEYAGKYSIYYGPILYGADISGNKHLDFDKFPPIDPEDLSLRKPKRDGSGRLLIRLGNGATLCDFRRLGMTGSLYKTWFSVRKGKTPSSKTGTTDFQSGGTGFTNLN